MKIRAATNRDTDKIRDVVFQVLVEYGLKPDPEGTDADLKDIEGNYIKAGGVFEVVETEDGRIIGTVGLFPKSAEVCELRKMYLMRETRGHGLGKQLLERMLATARTLGFRRMELETASPLKEAIALYQRYGFRPLECTHLASRCDRAFVLDLNQNSNAGI